MIRRTWDRLLRRLAHRLAPSELRTALDFAARASNPIFPKRNVTVSSAVPEGPVLVCAPHPDDEAIGLGGTLVKHVRAGHDVTVLYLTDGGGLDEPRAELAERRRAESRAVGEHLGLRQVFWAHADTRLTNDGPTVAALTALLDELKPAQVYAPSPFDTHFDHFATNEVLADALGEVGHDPTVHGYEVWDTIPFANHLVDVSDVIEEKERVLAFYRIPHEYTDFTALCRQRSQVHYTLHVSSARADAERGFAEAFLRFDAAEYRRLFGDYRAALRRHGSELATRRDA